MQSGNFSPNGMSRKPYDGANIRFMYDTVPDHEATKKAKRPMVKDVEILMVQYPGGDKTPVQVTDMHREYYKEQYEAFRANREQPIDGTPLKLWPQATRALIENLGQFGIRSVEQLANASGEAKRKLGSMGNLCKDAKRWLEAADSDQNTVACLQKELEEQKASAKFQKMMLSSMSHEF